jgi:acyl-CoA dehydrogenase
MKVTTEGEKLMEQLLDIIAAKGFESDMYFEEAIQSIKGLPKLEGTVHVNMALVIKFMPNFFGLMQPHKEYTAIPKMDDTVNDDFLFDQGTTRGLSKIQFDDFSKSYELYDTPNVNIFKSQIEAMKEFMIKATPNMKQADDFNFLLKSGEIFSNVVYGKLILENAKKYQIEDDVVDQIFDVIIRDFSHSSLSLFASPTASKKQEEFFMKMIMKPVKDKKRFQRVLEKHVYSLIDKYEMSP